METNAFKNTPRKRRRKSENVRLNNDGSDMEEMTDEDMEAEIYKDMSDGQSAGISGTPGFLVNGQVLSGAHSWPTDCVLI